MAGDETATGYLAQVSGNALYRSVVRAMTEGVVILDHAGHILEANPSAERVLGLTTDQLVGRAPTDPRWRFLRPDGRVATADEVPSAITLRTGRPCRGQQLGVLRGDGGVAWLSVNTDIVADESGKIRLIVATFTDVTESVRAKAALDKSRAHLEHVIDLAPGVVYQLLRKDDGGETMTFVSKRVQTMLGLTPDALERSTMVAWERVHPDDVAAVRTAFETSQRELAPLSFETRFRGPKDEWIWLRSHAFPDRVDGGVAWTGIVLDVSGDHVMAERMRRSARREAMGEMAAGLAHNFNNLLAAILPNIQLALESDLEPRPLLEDALQASKSAADLVRQLLGFTRNEAFEPPTRAVELTSVVRETLRFCRRTFDSRIRIVDRIADTNIDVMGQPTNLQQVVLNLCLNARDAVKGAPSPRIVVELATVEERQTTFARLVVSDNGIGMAPEIVRRLGEPFFTTKPPGQGTGLGLATIFGIVRDSGGTIRCDSVPTVGTRFEVLLPRCASVDEEDERATRLTARRMRGVVMIVDDEPLVRVALSRQLGAAGLEACEAASGDEALELLAGGARLPDLVLLDLAMPGLSGEQVLEELGRRWPYLPVIVLSGNRGPSHVLDGARAVLRKPVDRDTLLDAIAGVIPPAQD